MRVHGKQDYDDWSIGDDDDEEVTDDVANGCGGGCGCGCAYVCGVCGEIYINGYDNDCLECGTLYEIYLNEID